VAIAGFSKYGYPLSREGGNNGRNRLAILKWCTKSSLNRRFAEETIGCKRDVILEPILSGATHQGSWTPPVPTRRVIVSISIG
jgi:hypothetical protein